MNNFIYYTPTRVYFGKDEELKTAEHIKELGGTRVLVHFGGESARKSGLLEKVIKLLDDAGLYHIELGGVRPNPELPLVRKGIKMALENNIDFILAIGGGSVIDSSKDIANGAANPGIDVWDFSAKRATPEKTLKKGAILTLAAAGSEMSDSCVITNPEILQKCGYNSPCNRMDFAIENPELSYTVNRYQTACGGVDIAMHTIERYFNPGEDTYLTDSISEAVIRSSMKAAVDAYNNPNDYAARANMMWASSLAHNGLTQCGRDFLLTVHQLEHVLSAMYPEISHGAGLAALWCSWARYSYSANIPRWLQFSHNVWNLEVDYEHPDYTILKAIELQENYYRSIGMPISLRELDVKENDLENLALACSINKTRVLPGYKELGYQEMLEIYQMAF
jgi:alcohol dehydrogenase YqhD (iron-dependent ADH family)